jgi:hypothetical protein
MLRFVQDLRDWASLAHGAGLQNQELVSNGCDDTKIVGDQQQTDTQVRTKVGKQLKNRSLY